MRFTPIKTSFNAGIFSPLMAGRTDVDKYNAACEDLTNFIPVVQGAAIKRSGTKYVATVKNSSQKVWLQSFVFNYQQSFILEFGVNYLRFYNNYAQLTTGATTAWDSFTNYTIGDIVSYPGATSRYYCKADNLNKQPDTNPNFWYPLTYTGVSGLGSIYEIPTPYDASDLTTSSGEFGLSLLQSADVIYIACRNRQPYKLERISNLKWVFDTMDLSRQPFKTNNTDKSVTVQVGGVTSYIGSNFAEYNVTLTASGGNVFTSSMIGTNLQLQVTTDDVVKPWAGQLGTSKTTNVNDMIRNDGKYYGCSQSIGGQQTWYVSPVHTEGGQWDGDEIQWWYLSDQLGIVKITGVTNATTAAGTVIRQVPDNDGGTTFTTWAWSKSAWNSDDGYPTHVTLFRDRLVFARDQTLWFSCSSDYENFYSQEFGQVLDDSAITATVPFEQVSQVNYLVPTKNGLLVGSTDGEALVTEASLASPFSPTNIQINLTTHYGSAYVAPLKVDDVVLFVQRANRKIRESIYDINSNNVVANDLTLMSENITESGVIDMTFQREPYNILWAVRRDGILIGFTYNRAQNVTGWHMHKLGGTFGSSGFGEVQCVKVIPSFDGARDDLWLLVKRTINGSTVQSVEYMTRTYDSYLDDQEDAYYLDMGSVYSGSSTTTISGLTWLPNTEISCLVNGAVHPNKTTNGSGSFTLDYAGTVVQAGLPYTSTLSTMRLEGGSQVGTSQGKKKQLTQLVARVYNTAGLQAGTGEGSYPYVELDQRNSDTPMGTPTPLYSGDLDTVEMDSPITQDCYIKLKSEVPLPATVIALSPVVEVYEK